MKLGILALIGAICIGALGLAVYENQNLKQQLTGLTAPSGEAKTECVRMHVAAFRLMEARQAGISSEWEAREIAYRRLSLGLFPSQRPRYERYFDQMMPEVWSYSREIDEEEQERVANAYADIVELRCLERYAPRMVHPQIAPAEICQPETKDLCDAIPAAQIGQDLCDEMLEVAGRTGHYINASQDMIDVLAPSFERERDAGNLSARSIDNAAFLKEATQITLAELEAATGMLAIAAREICELG